MSMYVMYAIPGTGINCAFCMADPIMNAQQPMPAMPIQHDRQHEGFCSLRLCDLAPLRYQFNAKTQRRRDAKGGVKLWLHIQLTLMQKSSICGGAKYTWWMG